jgi:hypothetical protein
MRKMSAKSLADLVRMADVLGIRREQSWGLMHAKGSIRRAAHRNRIGILAG